MTIYFPSLRFFSFMRGTRLKYALGYSLLSLLMHNSVLAETLPNLSEKCFIYTPGQESGNTHQISSKGFSAQLVGTDYSMTVDSLTLTDKNNLRSPEALSRINAAASYGVLSAAFHGLSPNCQGQALPEIDEIKGSRPEAQWNGVVLLHKGHAPLSLKSVHLSVPETSPSIHAIVKMTGIQKHDVPLTPDNILADLSFLPAAAPPFKIILHDVQARFGKSLVEAKGNILAAANIQDSTANMHLSITEINDLINNVKSIAPLKVTTALRLARLFGEKDGPHVTGWNIILKNAKIQVNDIPIPIGLH